MAELELKGPGAGRAADNEEAQSDWQWLVTYVQENPRTIVAGVLFLLACILAGALFSLYNTAKDRQVMTGYAAALVEEDAATRAEELKEVAAGDSRWSVEALYLAGEASIEAKAYEDARDAFAGVLSKGPKSAFAAPAAEGLAFLDENAGKLDEALAGYQNVFATYSDTFIGRRQPTNIARVQEALGQLPEAVASYELQVERFPDSALAGAAEQALARLKASNPDLFPEEAPLEDMDEHAHEAHDAAEPTADSPTVETAPAEAPASESPAAAAPAEVDAAPDATVETPSDES